MTGTVAQPQSGMTKGWCPHVFRPLNCGDGLLMRIKPRNAILSHRQAYCLAELAQNFGNDIIELTGRANIQLRGIQQQNVDPFVKEILDAGLAHHNHQCEAARNIMVNPFNDLDGTASFISADLIDSVEEIICAQHIAHKLPAKFSVIMDGGGDFSLSHTDADICLIGQAGRIVLAFGGSNLAAAIAPTQIKPILEIILRAWLEQDHDGASHRHPLRKSCRDAAVGADAVMHADAVTRAVFSTAAIEPDLRIDLRKGVIANDLGYNQLPDRSDGTCLFGIVLGRLNGQQLQQLADIAVQYGDGQLRLTPWRKIGIAGVPATEKTACMHQLAAVGLITGPEDPRGHVSACVGAPYCRHAHRPTLQDAAQIAHAGTIKNGHIHLSGCTKGCARPNFADITLWAGPGGTYRAERSHPTHEPGDHYAPLNELIESLED